MLEMSLAPSRCVARSRVRFVCLDCAMLFLHVRHGLISLD